MITLAKQQKERCARFKDSRFKGLKDADPRKCRKESPDVIADQRLLVEDLARSNGDYIKRFDQMKLSIDAGSTSKREVGNFSAAPVQAGFSAIHSVNTDNFLQASFDPMRASSDSTGSAETEAHHDSGDFVQQLVG